MEMRKIFVDTENHINGDSIQRLNTTSVRKVAGGHEINVVSSSLDHILRILSLQSFNHRVLT